MFKLGLRILEAKVGIMSNKRSLFPQFPLKIEVKSLLTDFCRIDKIPYSAGLDGYLFLEEKPEAEPHYRFIDNKATFRGPLNKLSREASDLRYSLWGNQGFLYRYILFLLEKYHRIYNLHACGLINQKKNILYVIAGGAGSGKTVYLLSGLERGLKLFSTETVHFRIEKGTITWFMGSLIDNVRLGTLIHDFPQYLPQQNIGRDVDEWQKKIALDLSSYKNNLRKIANPRVVILLPKIEEGRKGFLLSSFKDERIAAKAIFDNISQKLSETVILYDKIPILGLDKRELASKRWKSVTELAHHQSIIKIASVLTNPGQCWGDLLN